MYTHVYVHDIQHLFRGGDADWLNLPWCIYNYKFYFGNECFPKEIITIISMFMRAQSKPRAEKQWSQVVVWVQFCWKEEHAQIRTVFHLRQNDEGNDSIHNYKQIFLHHLRQQHWIPSLLTMQLYRLQAKLSAKNQDAKI